MSKFPIPPSAPDEKNRVVLLDSETPFANKCWLLDVENFSANEAQATFRVEGDDPKITRSSKLTSQVEVATTRLSGGFRDGVQVVRVRTPRVHAACVLTRGGGISSLAFDGIRVGWKSPVPGPIHPQFVPLYRPDGLGWLAGFDEVLARCGLFNVGGPQFSADHQLLHPLHGDIAYQPCQSAVAWIDAPQRMIVIESVVDIVLFHFHHLRLVTRTGIAWDRAEVVVRDSITNCGARPAEIMLLHHWNFGPPVAQGGSRLTIPAAEVAPRNAHASDSIAQWDQLQEPQAGSTETVYFIQPLSDPAQQSHALLCSPDQQQALRMTWDASTMPHLTIWKNPVAEQDGYAVGIEPGSCFPNGREHESSANRLIPLAADQSVSFDVKIQGIMNDPAAVETAKQQLQRVQELHNCQIRNEPQAKFGPVG